MRTHRGLNAKRILLSLPRWAIQYGCTSRAEPLRRVRLWIRSDDAVLTTSFAQLGFALSCSSPGPLASIELGPLVHMLAWPGPQDAFSGAATNAHPHHTAPSRGWESMHYCRCLPGPGSSRVEFQGKTRRDCRLSVSVQSSVHPPLQVQVRISLPGLKTSTWGLKRQVDTPYILNTSYLLLWATHISLIPLGPYLRAVNVSHVRADVQTRTV